MKKTFLLAFFTTALMLQSCSLNYYLTKPQIDRFVENREFLEVAEKRPNTVVAYVEKPNTNPYGGDYFLTIKDTSGFVILEEPIYFHFSGVGYFHLYKRSLDWMEHPYLMLITQQVSKQKKRWAEVRLQSEIANITP